tara:strand:- start:2439 stop:3038 length:600 start_codon:yes stop_codon:yes gene_type:complete
MPCVSLVNPSILAQPAIPQDLQVGSQTVNVTYLPQNGYYDYSQTALLFNSSEITPIAGKSITGISLFYRGWTAGFQLLNQNIYLYDMVESNFSTMPLIDYSNYTATNATPCKTNFDIIVSNGWMRFDFTTNYNYTGNKNLLISLENFDGSWTSGFGGSNVTATNAIGNTLARWEDDNFYPTGSAAVRTTNRCNIIFHYQ